MYKAQYKTHIPSNPKGAKLDGIREDSGLTHATSKGNEHGVGDEFIRLLRYGECPGEAKYVEVVVLSHYKRVLGVELAKQVSSTALKSYCSAYVVQNSESSDEPNKLCVRVRCGR